VYAVLPVSGTVVGETKADVSLPVMLIAATTKSSLIRLALLVPVRTIPVILGCGSLVTC
jgi:deoxycytidine triphosphate deaminase